MELLCCTIAYNGTGAGGTNGVHGGNSTGGGPDGLLRTAGVGGGICSSGLFVRSPSLINTIVAANPALGKDDVSGAFNSLGNNLVYNTHGSTGFSRSGDLSSVAPELRTLENNGGHTLTHLPYPFSRVSGVTWPSGCGRGLWD